MSKSDEIERDDGSASGASGDGGAGGAGDGGAGEGGVNGSISGTFPRAVLTGQPTIGPGTPLRLLIHLPRTQNPKPYPLLGGYGWHRDLVNRG